MKFTIVILMLLTMITTGAERLRPIESLRAVMTDEKGLPLDDGKYNVTFKVYNRQKDGFLISQHTELVEAKDGTCKLCHDKLNELKTKGYKEVWVSTTVENFPESKFRIRVFLDQRK